MSTSGGNEPAAKKFKSGDGGGRVPPRNLREEYLRILNLMLKYRTRFWVFPSANSPEFHQFVWAKGFANISQERLTRALLFMEESFRDIVRSRGINTHFMNRYLEERFRLSQLIWGQINQDSDDVHEKGAVVENPDDLDDDVDEAQDVMDTAILRALYEFITGNGGAIPEPDSDVFYNFLGNIPIPNIPQDLLVDRILMLEENFNRIETIRMMEFDDSVKFANPWREEIYNLSMKIWGYENGRVGELYDVAEMIYVDQNGQDFEGDEQDGHLLVNEGAGVGNLGDERDGQVGAEDGGVQEDGQGGVEAGGVQEGDLGTVED